MSSCSSRTRASASDVVRARASSAFCDESSSVRCLSAARVSWMVREIKAVIAITEMSEKNRMIPTSIWFRSPVRTNSETSVAT